MKDLYRCLDEYIPELLRGIAQAWGISLPAGEPRELVLALGGAMLAPHALERALDHLPPEPREALGALVREGGTLPSHRLALKYGAIRRLGPARMAREEPWKHPANALEELFYRGFIYRAYDHVGGYYGEVLIVPQQLMERLIAFDWPPTAFRLDPLPAPPDARGDGDALVEDLFAILVHLRRTPVRWPKPQAIGQGLTITPLRLDLGGRLSGEDDPERWALLWRLLTRLRLIHEHRGALQPSLRAREWLRLPARRRAAGLLAAWRDDPQWNELLLLPSLQCEDTGWQSQPVAARRALLAVLAQCPAETWLSLAAFVQALKAYRPDYLRPDGDFDSWYIRDAQTQAYLTGFAAWEQIEGALARHLIGRSLRWLGLTDIGYQGDPAQAVAFRLTPLGRALLDPQGQDNEPLAEAPTPPAIVGEDLTVTIPLANTLYERYQLERFAVWRTQDRQSLDGRATYQITADSIWKSQNAGIKTEQILRFLRRISQDHLPPAVARALQAWEGKLGRVTLRRIVLLQAADEQTMRQIVAHREIRALLGEALSPTLYAVAEDKLEALIERLQALGMWPHVKV